MAETQEMERDGNPGIENWDSLSDRIRKARRQGRTLMQQHKGELLHIIVVTKSSLTLSPFIV